MNFAQYSCGNFTSHYPIPAYMSSYGPGAILFEHTEQALHSLLDKVQADDPSRTPDEQKMGDFYASCMDTDAIQAAGLKPLQPEFDRIAALKDKKELTGLLAHYQLINVTAFFNYFEQQDFKDARKQIAGVDQAGLGLPERDYYLRTGEAAEKTRQQYVQHLTTMLKLLGEPEAKAASDAQKIMELETALAKVSMDITSRRDPKTIYHPMTVAQLAELTPDIDWAEFFERYGYAAVYRAECGQSGVLQGPERGASIHRSGNHQNLSALAVDQQGAELRAARRRSMTSISIFSAASYTDYSSSGTAGSGALRPPTERWVRRWAKPMSKPIFLRRTRRRPCRW